MPGKSANGVVVAWAVGVGADGSAVAGRVAETLAGAGVDVGTEAPEHARTNTATSGVASSGRISFTWGGSALSLDAYLSDAPAIPAVGSEIRP